MVDDGVGGARQGEVNGENEEPIRSNRDKTRGNRYTSRCQLNVIKKGISPMFRTRPVRHALVGVFALACAACASPQWDPNNTEAKDEPVYRTGSHIPVKDPASSPSKSVDVQSVQDSLRTSNQRSIPPAGH